MALEGMMVRSIAAALSAALLMSSTLAVGPARADTDRPKASVEAAFVEEINRERTRRGLSALRVSLQQQRKGREHSQLMRDTGRLHHPASLGSEIYPSDAWAGVAENAGRSRSVERGHANFMASDPHRRNILGDWTHVAVGVAYDGNDIWITQRFVRVRPGHVLPMFRDMPSSSWKRSAIQRAWLRELLQGCGRDRVCADRRLSRAQMATMVARAAGYGDRSALTVRFDDVRVADTHAPGIGALVERGVTLGCTAASFCPDAGVSRAEAASLISRARRWTAEQQRYFRDVPPEATHYGTVNRLAERGVTNGCARSRYCPRDEVSRVEAARMLDRSF
jgi:uncharacterized protein YkwD